MVNKGKTNQMQQMMIYWQSVIPQHVSGSLRLSSGEQTACHCLWFHVLAMVVVVPESRVARCVHCAEDVALLI
jgi:hypothetical protein